MCDYSLHLIASRPAKVADRLVSTDFVKSITRGFTEIGQPDVAVCLLPGTELAFDTDVQFDRAFSMFGKARVEHREVERLSVRRAGHGLSAVGASFGRRLELHSREIEDFQRRFGGANATTAPAALRDLYTSPLC